MDIKRLNELADEYENLLRETKIEKYNTPINIKEEKAFFHGYFVDKKPYNPQFEYNAPPNSWELLFLNFQKKLNPNSFWERLLYNDVTLMILEMQATKEHSPEKITAHTLWAHGLPSKSLITTAKKILAEPLPSSNENLEISAMDAGVSLENALKSSGLNDWEVNITSEMNAKMMVKSAEKRVYVREGTMFSNESIKRLLVHEIGTHVFRYINGESQDLKFLRLGLMGYLPTEEGLATYHEKKYGVQDVKTLRRYALRVLAAYKSLSMSYYELFTYLSKYANDFDDLFDIIKRAKRGFIDTGAYGGHVKDQVYLSGFLKVSELLDAKPDCYSLLMSGKVSLDMLDFLDEQLKEGVLKTDYLTPSSLILI